MSPKMKSSWTVCPHRLSSSFVLLVCIFVVAWNVHTVDAQRSVFAGASNTCAILRLNNTKCWGRGGFNGNGNTNQIGSSVGTMGPALPDVNWGAGLQALTISMGGALGLFSSFTQVCAVVAPPGIPSSAVVKCFGSNSFGKQGREFPFSGGNQTIGDEAGEMTNLPAINLGTGLIPSDVSVGADHVCAVVSTINFSTDRRVKCWGKGSTGALGNGFTTNRGAAVNSMGDSLPFMTLTTPVLQIATGVDFTCVIASASSTVSGDVYCTGLSTFGQTGQDSTTQRDSPLIVNIGAGKTARSITAGNAHVCVLIHEDNQVKCWGAADDSKVGQLLGVDPIGIGDEFGEMAALTNLDFGGGLTVQQVEAGAEHTCVLLSNNGVKCFGRNDEGQHGINDNFSPNPGFNYLSLPAVPAINFGFGVVPISLAAGNYHTCAILSSTSFQTLRLKCWGDWQEGQLGLETTSRYGDSFQTRVELAPFVNVNEASFAPSVAPTTTRPSAAPSRGPTTSLPSQMPSTSRPSTTPSRNPTRSPSRSKAPTSAAPTLSPTNLPTKNPTKAPVTRSPVTTLAPTGDAAAAANQTLGVAIGASAGVLIFALAAFVAYRRRNSLFGNSAATGAPKNWYQEALTASPDAPSQYALSAAATKAVGPKPSKYNAPPMNNTPALPVQASYESGNPVYQGMKGSAGSSVRLSVGSNAPAPVKPSRDMVLDKLTRFYSKIDPNKSMADINELATFVELKGEEALYVKLKKKYGIDPNDTLKQSTSVVPDDVNV